LQKISFNLSFLPVLGQGIKEPILLASRVVIYFDLKAQSKLAFETSSASNHALRKTCWTLAIVSDRLARFDGFLDGDDLLLLSCLFACGLLAANVVRKPLVSMARLLGRFTLNH
jgi:hypothetical protein